MGWTLLVRFVRSMSHGRPDMPGSAVNMAGSFGRNQPQFCHSLVIARPCDTGAMPDNTPTVRARRLARALRKMREERRISQAQAAAANGWSRTKLTAIEQGTQGATPVI